MNRVSETAYLVAMYRALETERPDALFQDPLARTLAGGRGELLIKILGDEQQGRKVIAIRTCVMDELIEQLVKSQKVDVVINLGAGLDTRPYRLTLPPALRWIEVDIPDILDYKEAKLQHEQPKCLLQRIGLDLTDTKLRNNLFATLNSGVIQALVITEGLLSYLSEAEVSSLAMSLYEQPRFRWWLFELTPALALKRSRNNWNQKIFEQYFNENKKTGFLFVPANGVNFFQQYGWRLKEFRSIWESLRSKRRILFPSFLGLLLRWFAKSYWKAVNQEAGIVLLERRP
ncbi:MAG TPA: SAM-dependent methyltransferase [Coleofasciculaceae cyanobacterium]